MTDSILISLAKKPRPDFPLFPQGAKDQPNRLRWAKKVRGKLHYFGKVVDDPRGEAALNRWLAERDDLLAGRTPRKSTTGLTLSDACNRWLNSKRSDVDLGTLSARSFVGYSHTVAFLIETFGRDRLVLDLGPEDFESLYKKLSLKHSLVPLAREVTHVRSLFKYTFESDSIERPVKFGPKFKAPSKADKRKEKARDRRANGKKMFQADELRQLLAAARPQLKAMILLAINGGLGNTDCATLPLSALDLKAGWLDFPRPKTGIDRRVPLWPETVQALEAVVSKRGRSRDTDHAGLVFLTRLGQPWVRYDLDETKDDSGKVTVKGRADDAIAKAMAKLLRKLGIYRKGLSFYALRHTFETIAGGCRDQVAVDAIMGHVDASMASEYREDIEDARLQAAVNHVRAWLFG